LVGNSPIRKHKIDHLLGTKCDLIEDRKVSFAEGKAWAAAHGLPFMETSAKTNVSELFEGKPGTSVSALACLIFGQRVFA